MKAIISLLIISISISSFGQLYCGGIAISSEINFDDDDSYAWDYFVIIDSIENSNNIWQIGKSHKSWISDSYSHGNIIVTDTLLNYPKNDTSVFYIKHTDRGGYSSAHTAEFSGYYNVQSDSLLDYGKIEFSPDLGQTWIDVINDVAYKDYIYWETEMPILTGRSDGWRYFHSSIVGLVSFFNINYSDTVIYKFSFISDDNQDTLGGLAFDNFSFCDGVEGAIEYKYVKKEFSRIIPNPSKGVFSIEFENDNKLVHQLTIYNNLGEIVTNIEHYLPNEIIDLVNIPTGMYFYYLSNENSNIIMSDKFIKY